MKYLDDRMSDSVKFGIGVSGVLIRINNCLFWFDLLFF